MTHLTISNRLENEINRFFNEAFDRPARSRSTATGWPRVNIADGADEIALIFSLPGFEKENIKVTVTDNVLTVSGKRELSTDLKDANWVRTEYRAGEFSRSLTLPETVNTDAIKADYKNGLLEVRLAKIEEVKPKEIEVKVS